MRLWNAFVMIDENGQIRNSRKIAKTMKISKTTLGIVKQNITIALVVKLGIIILSALGLANMWIAVFGDVGVAIICILNAMRILSKRRKF